MDKNQSELLTIQQASKLLNCHPNTLRLWEGKGIIKPVRFGIRGDRRYPKEELLRLMNKDAEGKSLEDLVLPSSYDLTRIDMTGTQFVDIKEQSLARFKGFDFLEKEVIDSFDFKKFAKEQAERIQYFEQHELDRYAALEEKILHIITANRYRNGTLELINLDKYGQQILEKIKASIAKNEPVQFMLPAFPFKIANPLKSSRGDADLAEAAAFIRFNEINLQIKKLYKPGAQFTVFHDGHLYYRHFLHEQADADRYFTSLKKFVKELGFEDVIKLKDAFAELKKIDNFPTIYEEARKEISNLWKREGLRNERITQIMQAAKNNIKLADIPYTILYRINFAEEWDLTKEEKKLKKEIAERAKKCAFEYMVVQHALERAEFFKKMVPDGIRLTVHPKEGHIGIFLVKRKTVLLPWMGVGVIKANGELSVHYESELLSSSKYRPVFIKGEKYPFYYKEAETIYQGAEQFRTLFKNIASSLKKDDFYWAFAFSTEYLDKEVRKILVDAHSALAEKRIEDKAICRSEMFQEISQTYRTNPNIKVISTDQEIPNGIIILKDRVINLLWSETPSAYEIHDAVIIKRYQEFFKEVWESRVS